MTWLYWPHCITVYEMLLWINDILTFLVLFLIWCLLLCACPCWTKKKKPKKRLFSKSDLISSMYVYSRFTIKDCSSSQFSGSRFQSQHTTTFQHITIHRQKKCWITGSQKWAPPPTPPPPSFPTPCSNTASGETYLNIFLVSAVCWCIYAGLHQSSSKANSQGHASGRSFNRGASIMAPPSAQLTLTAAQENEDNKSQTQAAKAEVESTGNKIY